MDIRIQRTRTALQAALRDLSREGPLEQISIADICARAGVNRSSFYQHYPNKETLAADSIEAEIDRLAEAVLPTDPAEVKRKSPELLAAYLRHAEENEHLYRALASESAAAVVSRRLHQRITAIISATAGDQEPGGVPLEFFAAGVASATLGMIALWLSQEQRAPVETVAAWIMAVTPNPRADRGG